MIRGVEVDRGERLGAPGHDPQLGKSIVPEQPRLVLLAEEDLQLDLGQGRPVFILRSPATALFENGLLHGTVVAWNGVGLVQWVAGARRFSALCAPRLSILQTWQKRSRARGSAIAAPFTKSRQLPG